MSRPLPDWTPPPPVAPLRREGASVVVEPIVDARRFGELYDAFAGDAGGQTWRWLAYGPFDDPAAFDAFANATYLADDILFHAIVPRGSGRAEGVAALMRTDRANGVTEIGHICLAPSLRATRAASEAMFLLMERVFDLGYRRLEWKCNAENAASRRAAERYGFTFEGVFRQHMVVKGSNRDTAWYSIIDREWPAIGRGFAAWLAASNFDREGRQIRRLAECRQDFG